MVLAMHLALIDSNESSIISEDNWASKYWNRLAPVCHKLSDALTDGGTLTVYHLQIIAHPLYTLTHPLYTLTHPLYTLTHPFKSP